MEVQAREAPCSTTTTVCCSLRIALSTATPLQAEQAGPAAGSTGPLAVTEQVGLFSIWEEWPIPRGRLSEGCRFLRPRSVAIQAPADSAMAAASFTAQTEAALVGYS